MRVEGTQAADLNDDGLIDFYAASHLFLNQGDGTFRDVREDAGLPPVFDEGMRFLDWNMDGALDIVLVRPEHPPVLFEQVESVTDKQGMRIPRFVCVDAFPPFEPQLRYGINVFDLNNDGLEEILLGAAGGGPATLLTHVGDRYVRQGPGVAFADGHVFSTAGDLDGDGRLDLVVGLSFQSHVFRNLTPDTRPPIRVRVLGQGGALNQQGRVVRLHPEADSTFVVTRVVDSGSGYMSQRDYDLHFASPFDGAHRLEVRYATGLVEARVFPGQTVVITPQGLRAEDHARMR